MRTNTIIISWKDDVQDGEPGIGIDVVADIVASVEEVQQLFRSVERHIIEGMLKEGHIADTN